MTLQAFVADYIQPFLEAVGFSRSGSSFYRRRGDITDVINFQGSDANGFGVVKFYINCAMDSAQFRQIVEQPAASKPKYYDCLYNRRIGDITEAAADFTLATVDKAADPASFSTGLQSQLRQVLGHFETVQSPADLVRLAMRGNGLRAYEALCRYVAATGDLQALQAYIAKLHAASDDRWPLFAAKIATQIGDYADDPLIAQHL